MKKFACIMTTAFALMSLAFVSCDPNEGNADNTVPQFPEKVDYEIVAGKTVTVSFSANMDWTASLTADASGDEIANFTLLDGEMSVSSVSGKAGEAQVTVKSLAGGADFSDHTINLSLTMGSESAVIASITLKKVGEDYSVRSAIVNADGNGFVSAAPDGEDFVPSFDLEGEPLADNASINMVWADAEKGYRAYLRVTSNFEVRLGGSALENMDPSTSRNGAVTIVTLQLNNPEFEGAGPFDLVIKSDDGAVSHTYSVTVPAFTPKFILYPVAFDEFGGFLWAENEWSEAGFTYSYNTEEPIAAGSVTNLVWPEGVAGYSYHILVDANFNYSVNSFPEWFTVTDNAFTPRSSSGTMDEYDINVAGSEYTLAGVTDDLVFGMTGNDSYVYTYPVCLPACDTFFRSTVSQQILFNEEGQFQNTNGDYQDGPVTGNITSAAGLQFFFFSWNDMMGRFQSRTTEYDDATHTYTGSRDAAWMKLVYEWPANANVLNTVSVSLSVDTESYTTPRRGVIMAVPNVVVEEAGILNGNQLLNMETGEIADDYAKYIVANIQQGEIVNEEFSVSVSPDIDNDYYKAYYEFAEVTTEDELFEYESYLGDNIEGAISDLANGMKVYIFIYSNSMMGEGMGSLVLSGEYGEYFIEPDPSSENGWLSAELWDEYLTVFMGINVPAAKGSVGTITFADTAYNDIAVIYCVKNYE